MNKRIKKKIRKRFGYKTYKGFEENLSKILIDSMYKYCIVL